MVSIMDIFYYTVDRINGDYAYLKRVDTNDEIQAALALLPFGIDVGDTVKWENFEYSIV